VDGNVRICVWDGSAGLNDVGECAHSLDVGSRCDRVRREHERR